MPLLIDANNLAGRLGMLEEKNFDEKLINLLKKYIKNKGKRVILVFDSIDVMGDKRQEGDLTIFFSPKDDYYTNADVKIIEIIKNPEKIKTNKHDLLVVTDDRAIKESAEQEGVKSMSAEKFSLFLLDSPREESDKELNSREINAINKELLKEWG